MRGGFKRMQKIQCLPAVRSLNNLEAVGNVFNGLFYQKKVVGIIISPKNNILFYCITHHHLYLHPTIQNGCRENSVEAVGNQAQATQTIATIASSFGQLAETIVKMKYCV